MKTSLTLSLLLLLSLSAGATDKIVVSNTGLGWANSNNFLPSGVPQGGDAVYIPPGVTISVKGTVYAATAPTINVYVAGTLDFDPSGKLALSNMSTIQLHTGGTITSAGTSSELITLGGAVKYNGQNDGIVAGPKFASAATAVSGTTDDAGFVFGVLPIKLHAFTLSLDHRAVTLSWILSQDSKEDTYTVQRKTGEEWKDLKSFYPAAGIPTVQTRFMHRDVAPAEGTNLYRLKMRSGDGTVVYSRILPATFTNQIPKSFVFPNPASDAINVQWGRVLDKGRISVRSTGGNEVFAIDITTPISSLALDVSRWKSGTYYLTIADAGGIVGQFPFLKAD